MRALSLDGKSLDEWPGETHSCSEGRRRGRWAFKKKLQKKAAVVGLFGGLDEDEGEREGEVKSGRRSAQWAVVDGVLKIRKMARKTSLNAAAEVRSLITRRASSAVTAAAAK
eukprot:384209-Prymnesium_polylepis.1